MKKFNESDLIKGWFVGNFIPTIYETDVCEVALKRYKAGYCDDIHIHKIATEITFVVEGTVKFNNVKYSKGDIIKIEPNESSEFVVLTDAITVVVKLPSVKNDKYVI